MSKNLTCVLRPIAGSHDVQFVPVTEVARLVAGERVFKGNFSTHVENHGPSGSHAVTVCLPAGPLTEAVIPSSALHNGKLLEGAEVLQCVMREVQPGDSQYRPVADVHGVKRGEKLFAGLFRTLVERHGPYGSHSMKIALPFGSLSESVVAA